MTNNAICKNKSTAISILETIMEYIKSDMQQNALKAVSDFIQKNCTDDIPESYEEEQALILKIETELRDCLSGEQRREKAAFYLEGIETPR
jgi:uncharacterized protein YeeX (DUF496 family)